LYSKMVCGSIPPSTVHNDYMEVGNNVSSLPR
jgi:hypothetical protein